MRTWAQMVARGDEEEKNSLKYVVDTQLRGLAHRLAVSNDGRTKIKGHRSSWSEPRPAG